MWNPRTPVVEQHRIHLENHQRGLSGLTIAHLTDLHAGPSMRSHHIREIVEQVNDLHPDIIAITGDIMNWQREFLPHVVEPFRAFKARLGTFAILGNHDFYFGPKRLIKTLHAETPVEFVGKQRRLFEELDGFTLTGVNDPMIRLTEDHDYPELDALAAENESHHFHLLLTHRPDVFDAAHRTGYDLVLTGHTHGGQLNFRSRRGRAYNIAKFATPYDEGLFRKGRTRLYVSRGLGYTGVPLRYDCAPEIGFFTLC